MSRRVLWIAIASLAFAIGGVVSLCGILWNNIPGYRGDWYIFWLVARVAPTHLYHDLRALPFPYPPSALLLVKPFGGFSTWIAFSLWSALGIAAIATAARRIGASWGAIGTAAMMPCLLGCIVAGQTSLVVGAALMGGVAAQSPRLAMLLFGVALAIKPQSAVALPFALMAVGEWRRLAGSVIVAAAIAGIALALWGPGLWLAWLEALPHFRTMLIERHVDVMDVGVNGVRLRLGWPSWVHLVGVVLGVVMVVATWRGSREPMARYAALAGGAALISPYTLVYDLAGLSVVAAATLLDRKRAPVDWVVAAPILAGIWPNLGVIGLGFLLAWRYREGVLSGLEAIGLRRSQALGPVPIARD